MLACVFTWVPTRQKQLLNPAWFALFRVSDCVGFKASDGATLHASCNKHKTVIPITLWYKSHDLRPSSARRSLRLTPILHADDSRGSHRDPGTHLSCSNTGPAPSSYSFSASTSASSPPPVPPSPHRRKTPREWLPWSDCDISRRSAAPSPAAPDYLSVSSSIPT